MLLFCTGQDLWSNVEEYSTLKLYLEKPKLFRNRLFGKAINVVNLVAAYVHFGVTVMRVFLPPLYFPPSSSPSLIFVQ